MEYVLVQLYVSPSPNQLRVGVLVVIGLHADVSRVIASWFDLFE
jgi:hypothetical protein